MIYLLGAILCLPATIYFCLGIYGAIAFFKSRPKYYCESDQVLDYAPPVTVLKAVCGLDQETYANFASFCHQDYDTYQLLFAVRDPQDPVIPVIQQIMADFPAVDIQFHQSDRLIGANYKISNLAHALPHAKYEILVLADSDVRVDPAYLKTLVQPLQDPKVGAVTCLYRPLVKGVVATIEAIGISTEYIASILVANQLEGLTFALGPTIAISKSVLNQIGGLEAIAPYLADDYQIGYRTHSLGYKVVLSEYIIDHLIDTTTWQDLLDRQLRWAYCTRVSRPWGHLGLFFTFGIPTSLIWLMIKPDLWWLGAIAWLARLLLAWTVAVWGLKDQQAGKYLWLVPIRDLISFGIWLASWFSDSMNWRGSKLKLSPEGKLTHTSL